jgi:putative FmdB family regulatory protein
MPLYEYECESCGVVFEKMQKFADAPLTVHEDCGGHVHRLLTAPAFVFKGTGWYVTDYARGRSGDSNGGKKSDSENKKSDSEKKNESKSKPDSTSSSTSTSPAPSKSDK